MLTWLPFLHTRCSSSAEVEQSGLPPDLFDDDTTSIILVPGFTIGPPPSRALEIELMFRVE